MAPDNERRLAVEVAEDLLLRRRASESRRAIPREIKNVDAEDVFILAFLKYKAFVAKFVKIGLWIDYFPNSINRLRETKYPDDPEDTKTQVLVLKEWNDKGKLTIVDGVAVVPG